MTPPPNALFCNRMQPLTLSTSSLKEPFLPPFPDPPALSILPRGRYFLFKDPNRDGPLENRSGR
jgi:hypothetical protein